MQNTVYSWNWQDEDGNWTGSASGAQVQATWSRPGTYQVYLWVHDSHGARGDVIAPVTVDAAVDAQGPAIEIQRLEDSPGPGQISVVVDWWDPSGVDPSTLRYTWNGAPVTFIRTATENHLWVQGSTVLPLQAGENVLQVSGRDQRGNPSTSSFPVGGPPPPPSGGTAVVTAPQPTGPLALNQGASTPVRFEVKNPGSGSGTYLLSTTCTAGVLSCSVATQSQEIGAGSTVGVEVQVTAVGGAGSPGTVTLRAALGGSGASGSADQGIVLTDPNSQAPVVTLDPATAQPLLERELCLTIAVGHEGASECGDLRLVHALPTVRTYNKARTPVLLYNSQHAEPNPLVALSVTPRQGPQPLEEVRVTLRGGPANAPWSFTRSWPGSAFPAGQPRRVVLADPVLAGLPTGIHAYQATVAAVYGGTPHAAPAQTGELVVVNRKRDPAGTQPNPLGAGWGLAGLERIYRQGDTLVWVGGDGSVRRYTPAGDGSWSGPPLEGPDRIVAGPDNGYVRELRGGVKVFFDYGGRHVATENRLGQRTTFGYQGEALQTISVPTPGPTAQTYVFDYGTPNQVRITAPGPDRWGARQTVVTLEGGRVSSIADPDQRQVRFGYQGTSGRVETRLNRREHGSEYRYDEAGKLVAGKIHMEPEADSIVVRIRPKESRGHAALVSLDSLSTFVDGPRTDVADTTRFWLDRFGAPTRIRNALGHETEIERGNTQFPALVTEVRHPVTPAGRKITRTVYNGRGNVQEARELAPYGGVDAVTRYVYGDARWPDFATRAISPENDTVSIGYDDAGHRIWQHDAMGWDARVEFFYASTGNGRPCRLISSTRIPSQRATGSARDSIAYDALCNVDGVRTPIGFWTRTYRDGLGRDSVVVSPVDSAQTLVQEQHTTYDRMDRVLEVTTRAPARAGSSPLEEVRVVNGYDLEGNLESVTRRISPDPNAIGESVTRWKYDRANRRVRETAADLRSDSTVYDPAGNPRVTLGRRRHAEGAAHRVSLRYDELNRLVERTEDEVHYPEVNIGGWSFPFYGNGMVVPGDRHDLAYDALGNLTRADNRNARITRSYYPNGALRADTLRIRTWGGSDFAQHVYGLRYEYDLTGRRIRMLHPSQLAPSDLWSTNDTVRYEYEAGRLKKIGDFFRQEYSFRYNLDGQLDSLSAGGGYQRYFYDADGRLRRRVERGATGYEGLNRLEMVTDTIHDDWYSYDARGKVLLAYTLSDSVVNEYGGLGALLGSVRQALPSQGLRTYEDRTTEEYWPDPLGNLQRSRALSATRPSSDYSFEYEAGTGRQTVSRIENSTQTPTPDRSWYDEAGNVYQSARTEKLKNRLGGETLVQEISRHYYGANNKLHAVDRRSTATLGDFEYGVTHAELGVFEEHFYDALGRRVLTRARQDSVGIPKGFLQRTVWDGDQILYEIRYPGDDRVAPQELEWDTVTVRWERSCESMGRCGEHPDSIRYRYFYSADHGRVAYVHGPGIDEPLALVRIGYGKDTIAFEPFRVFPHANWRGLYDIGTFDNGRAQMQREGARVEIDWTGRDTRAYLRYTPTAQRRSWMGSLISGKRDPSGLLYMRNRYYDPSTGRFTQEDPIGLAGGLNLYGFANGDPVSYADPYGLRAEDCCERNGFEGDPKNVEREVRMVEARTPTDVLAMGAIGALATVGGVVILKAGAGAAAAQVPNLASRAIIRPTAGQLQQVGRQLEQHGVRSVQKSMRTWQRRLDEHLTKVEEIVERGGDPGSVQREINNFRGLLEAARQLLK